MGDYLQYWATFLLTNKVFSFVFELNKNAFYSLINNVFFN